MFKKLIVIATFVFALSIALPAVQAADMSTTDDDATTMVTAGDETSLDATSPIVPEEIAAADLDVAEPSVVPGSFWYPFKRVGEKIRELFTVQPESKIRLVMELANKRLMEARVLAKSGDTEKLKATMEEYKARAEEARQKLSSIDVEKLTEDDKDRLANIKEKMADHALKQVQVLEKVRSQVSEQAQESIDKNIEKAKERLQERLSDLGEGDRLEVRERLDGIVTKLPGNEATRADFIRTLKELGDNTKDEGLKNTLREVTQEQTERVQKMIEEGRMTVENGREILDRMQENIDRITEAKENAEGILERAQERVEETKEAIEGVKSTIQERLQGLKEAVTR